MGNIVTLTGLSRFLDKCKSIFSLKSEEPFITGSGAFSVIQKGTDGKASGMYSHAEGNRTIASGMYSHAEGSSTIASEMYSHAEGLYTSASGFGAHAEGSITIASKNYSHAEGIYTTASGYGAHAEGSSTVASRHYSHAEGDSTRASGQSSHAEGSRSLASGTGSHAEGLYTSASGNYSHAEGEYTVASGPGAHAEGWYTSASNQFEHAQGKYNVTASNQIFSIGVGDAEARRKNAISIITGSNTSASVYIYGVGGYDGINIISGVHDLATALKLVEFPKIAELDNTTTNVTAGEFSLFNMQGESDQDFTFSLLIETNVAPARANIWGGIITNIGDNCTVTFELESGEGIKWPDNAPEMVPGKTYEFNVIEDPNVYMGYGAYGILVEY